MKFLTSKILFLLIIISFLFGQNHKPYILAATSDGTIDEISAKVKTNLTTVGLEVIGEYSPAKDNDRKVLIITSDELKNAVKSQGGLTGFASTLRVAVTKEEDKINISYTNPVYMGNAYFRTDYDKVESNYNTISEKIETALSEIGETKNEPFGSKKGITEKALRKYRYMIGMQRFNDVVELNEFASFEDAINKIDSNLALTDNLVYSVEFPDQKLKLYGIAIGDEKGEGRFLPIIDISTPKHTAFLPYELLVIDKKVVMLHGRYRIALSFPDLTMMTFSKIMSTPGDIKKSLQGYTK